MTDPSAIAVTQEDREAAADAVLRRLIFAHGAQQSWMAPGVASIRKGEEDDHDEVQAFARHRIAAEQRASAPVASVDDRAGWIVGNGAGDRWRCWQQGMSAWTADRNEAVRYARREDAEAAHAEDDDAWRVEPFVASMAAPHPVGRMDALGTTEPDDVQPCGIRINGQPATAADVIAIGREMDTEDGGYPDPALNAQRSEAGTPSAPPAASMEERAREVVKMFDQTFDGMQSRVILAHQLRASAGLMDADTKRNTGWADTSDRAQHMRDAADMIERLAFAREIAPAPVGGEVERLRTKALDILQHRWQFATGAWDADDWVETDAPRRFAEHVLAALTKQETPDER